MQTNPDDDTASTRDLLLAARDSVTDLRHRHKEALEALRETREALAALDLACRIAGRQDRSVTAVIANADYVLARQTKEE